MAVVFVTGATGFIGKEVVKNLVKGGHTVLALIRSKKKWEQALAALTPKERESCIGVIGDLRKERLGLSSSDYQRVMDSTVIIHAGVPMDITLDEMIAREVILQGADHLLGIARELHQKNRLQKLIHIVGYMSPFDDESAKLSLDVFAETNDRKEAGGYEKYKFLADVYLRQIAHREGLPLVVVNPSTVIGPRHTGSTEQRDGLGLLINAVRQGKFPVLPWGKEWWLPLISLDDLAVLILGIVELEQNEQKTYYALNGREDTPSFPELIQLFAKELRMKQPTTKVPLSALKKILRWGGSHLFGVPANSMDFIVKREFPLLPFQQIKEQRGVGEYKVTRFIPHVVADLDYRLSMQEVEEPPRFTRERLGKMAAYRKVGTGTPWVFLHGLLNEMSDWLPVAEQLKQDPVWLLDLPGFGRSPYHHHEKLIEGYIQTVIEAIQQLPSSVHLVGHSFGAYLAAQIAKRIPERIEQLYLLQPPIHAPRYPSLIKKLGGSPSLIQWVLQKHLTPKRLLNMLLEQGVFRTPDEIPADYLENVRRLLQSPRISKSNSELLAFFMREYEGMEDDLLTTVPTHLMWGSGDKVYQLSRELEEWLVHSGAHVKRLDLAHNFPISHPGETAEFLSAMRNQKR